MTEYFQNILLWIQQNPDYAGWVIFSMALIESLAIIGVLIPGVIILFGAGTLIGAGVIGFWSSFFFAVAGAIIGDALSYWLGRHFEETTQRWPWFRVHPEALQKGVIFFEKYGDLSVALGRFFGPIRAIIPMIAGLMHMPPKRFFMANVLSALVWAPAYLIPGMLVGAATEKMNWSQLVIPAAGVFLIIISWLIIRKIRNN